MRFLHTADWHVGKKLGRIDRTREVEQALDEIVEIARDEKVDAVLVAGDLLDGALPPLESISLVIDALSRLASVAGKVVAMPGNHDSASLFTMLAPLLEPRGIVLVPRIVRPADGGVVTLGSRDGKSTMCVGVFPFLHEAAVVDFMSETEEWFKGYAQRIRLLSAALCEGFAPGSVGVLLGHYFVEGAEVGGGERKIHIGQQYAATAQAIPPGAAYVALGHIHRPQEIAGAAVRARYAGSLLQLDFSERSHTKEVVIVEANPNAPAKVKSISLNAGRKLIRVEDELEALFARTEEFGDAYLDVRVKTGGPTLGLAEQVRKVLPNAVIVQAVYDRLPGGQVAIDTHADRALTDLYADFYPVQHGVEVPADVLEALRSIEEEVVRAAG